MKHEKIKEYRMKKMLSQTELAKLLDIDRSYMNSIETGRKVPSVKLLERIASVLGRSLKDFF